MASGAAEAHLAVGGNARYSAHRSEGDTQATAAAAERPALPTEDAGAALGAMLPSDAQSLARRIEDDTAIPGEAGGVRPDGCLAPCNSR